MVRGDCEVERGISFLVFLSFSSNFVISRFLCMGIIFGRLCRFFRFEASFSRESSLKVLHSSTGNLIL